MYENELMHYGVKGMRWGVRRDRLQKSAQKTAKKLATLKAKEYYEKTMKLQIKEGDNLQ